MRNYFLTLTALFAVSGSAAADVLPFTNLQPSLVVTEVVNPTGIFPSRDSGGNATGDMLGFVYDFAGNFAPGKTIIAQGQLLSLSQNTALFSLLGNNYGGNGTNNFALPNLAGRAIIGTDSGIQPGQTTGSATVTLTAAQLPPVPQPFNNVQPSLPLTTLIATGGYYPSQGGGSGTSSFIGQIANFAGSFAPNGWAVANGQLLSIEQNVVLFSIIGTAYGGDGVNTFALPNLVNTTAIGASPSMSVGTTIGQASTTLTQAQVNGTSPVSNYQPSLAVNYLIATNGIFPSQGVGTGFDQSTPTLGEITAFAGAFAPSGWMFANGQLLSIAQNQALFSLLGTAYGGDGRTTFALPDLRGRTLLGSGIAVDGQLYTVGDVLGTAQTMLTANNLPSIPLPVPEPASYAMMLAGLAMILAYRRGDNSSGMPMAA